MKKPDWKKTEDYDYTDKLYCVGWAWEFLRRNPDYVKDYESYQKGDFKDVTYEPPRQSGETDNQWEARCILKENVDPRKIDPEQILIRKWGLKYWIYNSSLNALELAEKGTPIIFEMDAEPTIIKKWNDVASIPTEEIPVRIGDQDDADVITVIKGDRLLVLLDVTKSITPQLDVVRHHFKQAKAELAPAAKKKSVGTPQGQTFVQGIRALDGHEAGFSNHEIAEIVFVGDKADIDVKIHNCLKAAKKNMKYRYRAIANSCD